MEFIIPIPSRIGYCIKRIVPNISGDFRYLYSIHVRITICQLTTSTTAKSADADPVKKAVPFGKETRRNNDITRVEIARKMYQILNSEPTDITVEAFMEGADLTPTGAIIYFYNCKRQIAKTNEPLPA